MNDDLSRIPFLIELSRRTRTIIAQNIAVAILVAVVGLILAATGSLGLIGAALYHVFGDVLVIGNSFRLFRFGEAFASSDLTEVEGADMAPRKKRQGSMTLSGAPAQTQPAAA